ncbi:MAG TPA: type II secretion system protein GspJ [Candidatus Brocadiaceae bacterium]
MKTHKVKSDIPTGFTLIELLIAIALTSLLLVALYGTFFSVIRSQSGIAGELERSREISRFVDNFTREIHSAFYKGNNSKTSFVGNISNRGGRVASDLTFTAFTYPILREENPHGDLIGVRYFAEEPQPGKITLYKDAWDPYTDKGEKGSFKVEIIDDIESFEVSYFNGRDWVKAWDSKIDKKIPAAVKAVIAIKEKGGIRVLPIIARSMIR